jgi:energy-converting hydrogenase A subunit R
MLKQGGGEAFGVRGVRKYVTDGEGPVTKNDNAYELSKHYVKGKGVDGGEFFTVISSYDDVLAYIVKRENYKAGDTLRLILPFLKAYGASNQGIIEYSKANILLMPKVEETLLYIHGELNMPTYMISTSYEPYVKAVRSILRIPFREVYCTKLDIDRYKLPKDERRRLMKLSEEICSMKPIKIPLGAQSLQELSEEDWETFRRLDEIFWKIMPEMEAYKMVQDVNPIGGPEKVNALRNICESTETPISELMYVGDSITDVEALRTVKEAGGLSVSFNGNNYAVFEAEVAVLSPEATPLAILAEVFKKHGLQAALRIAEDWGEKTLRSQGVNRKLVEKVFTTTIPVKVYRLRSDIRDQVSAESSVYRKTVRGEKVGALG